MSCRFDVASPTIDDETRDTPSKLLSLRHNWFVATAGSAQNHKEGN
ncbi:hypothetical protein RBWH47_04974 [Rhodopirellula baltica WH47]|uniref:Uncharacterized protein n=1 Tax=Rhodopirellula baltica WH47 TaxID=991778 RepID=F2AU10_RHOBT|nr:hypothetical protein RBWH47_04974 [Rhodopirellula baltica WH47]